MRTIKFRAWVQEKNRMIPVYGFNADHVFEDTLDGVDVGTNVFPAKTCELMQFTGLHDKNGKEIYEGDVLKIEKWSCVFRVIWHQTYARFTVAKIGTDLGRKMDYIPEKECEVIGNIYEPSLTKKP